MDYNIWMFPHLYNKNFLPSDYNVPPTIYSILNSYVNYENPNPVKISNLAKAGREVFFDFDYPIATGMTKEEFESMILNHFMMRRIGYETVTAFKLALNVKINEIMPMYIKLFNAINGWEIFQDGEVTTRTQTDSRTYSDTTTDSSTNTASSTSNLTNVINSTTTSDRRYSDTPENSLLDIRDGKYVSDYNYDTNTDTNNSSSNGTASSNTTITNNGSKSSSDNGNINETITRTPADKMTNYVEFIKQKQNIFTLIFKDLDSLFYQII